MFISAKIIGRFYQYTEEKTNDKIAKAQMNNGFINRDKNILLSFYIDDFNKFFSDNPAGKKKIRNIYRNKNCSNMYLIIK